MTVQRGSTIIITSLVLYALLFISHAYAGPKRDWSVSPLIGVHRPSITHVNHGLFQAPFAGTSELLTATGASSSNLMVFQNPLQPFNPGPYAGLEFSWRLDDKLSWIGGFASWQASSSGITSGVVPFQRNLTHVIFQRTATFSYNEVFIGLRRDIFRSTNKYRLYGRFSLNTLIDIDLRENMLFHFKIDEGDRVSRSIIVESQTTAALLAEPGLGAEMYIGERFSLAIEGSYTQSMRKTYFRYATRNEDFKDSDGYGVFRTPSTRSDNGTMEYLDANGVDYRPMPLEFNGWKLLIRISMFY